MINASRITLPGVSFGGKHTWNNYRLILDSLSISMPEVQSTLVQIPGRDGLLRLTEARDGTVHYNNRTFSSTFSPNDKRTFINTVSELATALHGKRVQIICDFDKDYYYYGEMTVEPDYDTCSISISGSLEPYKVHRTSGAKKL